MNEDDLIVATTIETFNPKYKLSALLMDGKHKMAALEIVKPDGKKEFWDNVDYLYGELISVLRLESPDIEDISDSIPRCDYGCVLSILEKGLELGFDYEYKPTEEK